MLMELEDATDLGNATFFRESVVAKQASQSYGRPKAIRVSPTQMEIIAKSLDESAIFLKDSAKFCRENDLEEGPVLPAAKLMDEHLPAVIAFCRRAYSEVGPAATAKALGRKTRIEMNQDKYRKLKRGSK